MVMHGAEKLVGFPFFAIVVIQGSLKTFVELFLSPIVAHIVNKIKHYEQTLVD